MIAAKIPRTVCCYVFREEHADCDHQSYNHHQRIVLRETCLCGPEQRRHQTRNESGDRVDESIDEIFIDTTDDTAEAATHRCETIDDAIDDARVKREDCARGVHRAARDGPTVKLVNPVFVVTGEIKRSQSLCPDVGQLRTLQVEQRAERHADTGGD